MRVWWAWAGVFIKLRAALSAENLQNFPQIKVEKKRAIFGTFFHSPLGLSATQPGVEKKGRNQGGKG